MVGYSEVSHDDKQRKNIQAVYAQILRKKQIFFHDLFEVRAEKQKIFLEKLNDLVGPVWYHVLSATQMDALDNLQAFIHQDILSGQPILVTRDLKQLGLNCKLNTSELMTCIYLARKDEKELFAHMFLLLNEHTFDLKRESYNHDAKLILSSMFYLGLNDIIKRLVVRFHADNKKEEEKVKTIAKRKKSISPYLEKMSIPIYNPSPPKRVGPAPLPDLSALNDVVEEEEALAPSHPPSPKLSAKAKNRISKSLCNKIAGIIEIPNYAKDDDLTKASVKQSSRMKRVKTKEKTTKKKYGLNLNLEKVSKKPTIIKPPTFDTFNLQHHVTAICTIKNASVYVLGNVTMLPPDGDIIHGGYAMVRGAAVNIYSGIRAFVPEKKSDPCDCLKYYNKAIDYVKSTKCKCGHYYCYGNKGLYPKEEIKYFRKPTGLSRYSFDYQNIYEMDPKTNLIQKNFDNLWDDDSVLNYSHKKSSEDDDGDAKKKKKKKVVNIPGQPAPTCLGDKPKVRDYLRCALNLMRRENLAAKLPDVYLAPELVEWMRNRIYGSYTEEQKQKIIKLSRNYSERYINHLQKTWHVPLPKVGDYYSKPNTWAETLNLKQHYKEFSKQYKSTVFQAHAKEANKYWAALFTHQIPNNKLREIFYSYMYSRECDMFFDRPFDSIEVLRQYDTKVKKAYRCPIRRD